MVELSFVLVKQVHVGLLDRLFGVKRHSAVPTRTGHEIADGLVQLGRLVPGSDKLPGHWVAAPLKISRPARTSTGSQPNSVGRLSPRGLLPPCAGRLGHELRQRRSEDSSSHTSDDTDNADENSEDGEGDGDSGGSSNPLDNVVGLVTG